MKNPNYSLLTKSKFQQEEQARIEFQKDCSHTFWATRCGVCSKILASDHHINVHTSRTFNKNNKIALVLIEAGITGDLDLYRIQEFKQLKNEFGFTEVTVLVDTIEHYDIYSELKCVNTVNAQSLDEEVKHLRKYRKEDVQEITVILYSDSDTEEKIKQLQTQCNKLKILTKII